MNTQAYDALYNKYEQIHGEIFNSIEQQRLHTRLERAIAYIETPSTRKEALDYGCGSGNLTNHLINLGLYVLSADVSTKFLGMVRKRYANSGMSEVLIINGQDLSNIENDRFDFVGAYSVLHHVPDYLYIIKEMIRVTRPGGVIYLDHEASEACWNRTQEYNEFLQLVALPRSRNWKKYLKSSSYINKIRYIMNPQSFSEGDIHVRPDDHIDWNETENLLVAHGCKIVLKEDYLLYRRGYPVDIYEAYKTKCSDLRVLVALRA